MKLRWRFGVLAGIFLAIFCLYPQFKMLYLRGEEWNGHYAYNDIDEVAYASYVRALSTAGRERTTLTPAATNRPKRLSPNRFSRYNLPLRTRSQYRPASLVSARPGQ
jgi:hypothetical protein